MTPLLADWQFDSDAIWRFLTLHWNQACQDPLGYTFWALIWGCAFAATFLLIRMFFTGWGDKNVTEKTLAVSIVVHVGVALFSTTVMLAKPQETPPELRTRVRRVVFDESREAQPASTSGQKGRPQWDEIGSRDAPPAERQIKPIQEESPVEKPDRENLDSPVIVSSSEITFPDESPKATEHRVSLPERPTRKGMVETPIDSERTATARKESNQVTSRPKNATKNRSEDKPSRTERAQPGNSALETTSRSADPSLENTPVPQVVKSSPTQSLPRGKNPQPDVTVGELTAGEKSTASNASVPGKFNRTRKAGGSPSTNEGTDPEGLERPVRGDPESLSNTGQELASRNPREVDQGVSFPAIGELNRSSESSGRAGKVPSAYQLRGGDLRRDAALKYGATQESEAAVAASLAWLARNQNPDGSWPIIEGGVGEDPEPPKFTTNGDAREEARQKRERSESGVNSETGITALAILAFLGAGHTPDDEQYGTVVQRGVTWLVAQQYRWNKKLPESMQRNDGSLGGSANRFARMYCHGIATIALGEAYGMTRDPKLREPLVRAVQFTIRMQYRDGSWRYSDWKGQENPTGDMSLFGWHLMAIKSAERAGIRLPDGAIEKALKSADRFLTQHQAEMAKSSPNTAGGLSAYRSGERPKFSMTAEALFCRQLLGTDRKAPVMLEAVEALRKRPPKLSELDLYYWYYATLALYQHGGDPWNEWNDHLLDTLVKDQRTSGPLAGSWNPRRPWGDFGGRVFSTAMSTLCLEVYYRYLPLYQFADEVPES